MIFQEGNVQSKRNSFSEFLVSLPSELAILKKAIMPELQ